MTDPPPKIETVDGVGAEFLAWTRDAVVRGEERIAELEQTVRFQAGVIESLLHKTLPNHFNDLVAMATVKRKGFPLKIHLPDGGYVQDPQS